MLSSPENSRANCRRYGRLTVASGGAITGSIDAGSLVLEPGNLVEARVKVGPPPKSAIEKSGRTRTAKETSGSFWTGGMRKLKDVFSVRSQIIFAA